MNARQRFHTLHLGLGVLLLFGLNATLSGLDPSEEISHKGLVKRSLDHEEEEEERERGPSDADGALMFRRLQMQDEKGIIPADGMEKARRHVRMMREAQQERVKKGIAPQGAGIERFSWIWVGPGNIGGRIRSILIHPTNPNRMWVGSVSGGIWRTENGGGFWSPVNDFLANLAVTTMIIDPVNPNFMYAGTGEGFNNIDAIQGAGVFKSTDGGVTWNQLAATANANFFFVNRLAISPSDNILLAATNSGLWRSVDGGANWVQVTMTRAFDVDFRSATLAIVGELAAARFTTDRGLTWTAATFTPSLTNGGTLQTNGRVELAYAPSFNAFVYAAVNQNNGDIYTSNNGGVSYSRVNTGTNFFLGATGSQGWYDNIVWVNPVDPDFVVVGGIHLWRSTNTGNNFTQISNGSLVNTFGDGSPHADHHMMVAHPGFNNTTNRTVFFGNDGGINRTDNIATANQTSGWFELNNGLGITQFYGAAGNPTSGLIVGGTQDNGTLAGRAGGFHTETFTQVAGSDGGFCAADPTNPNYFYGETQFLGVFRSDNGGVSGVGIAAGIADAGSGNTTNFIAPLVLDPNNPSTLFAGGLSLWRSQDVKSATPTWASVKPPIGPPAQFCPSCISAIAISPGSSNFVLVGHDNGDIYRSFNAAAGSPTWTKIDVAPLPDNRVVTRLVIDNTRIPNWIYATFGGFSADNVYRSTDLGATWTDITGTGLTGLPNVPVRSLVYHPRNPNLLYIGTEIGIFTSNDAGTNWEVPQYGPANVSVDELFWMGNDLIAATHGRGLYQASGGIYVDCNYNGFEAGTFNQPFKTILKAVNSSTNYKIIWIKPCNYNEQITIPTPISSGGFELRRLGDGSVIIGKP